MNNSETNTSSNTTAAGTSSINNSAASAPKVKRSFKSQNFNAKLGNQTKQPPVNGSPSLSHKQAQPPASTSPAPGVTQTSHIGAAGAHSNASALSNNSNSNPDTDIQGKLDALQKKLDEQNALIEAMMKMTAMSQGGAPAPAGGVGTTSSFNVAGNQNPTLQQQQTSAWAQQNRPWAPKPAPVSTSASDVRAFGSADEKSQEEIDKELAAFKTKSQRQGSMLKAQTTVEGKKDLENMLFGKDRHGTQGIDFEKYEAIPVETSGRDIPEALEHGFSTNIFSDNLMHNIERAQYFTPTPIQRYSIPMVLAGRDVMACAQTGSGKTAAFLFPIITKLEQGKIIHTSRPATGFGRRTACPRGLVLAPTRELSSQIHEEAMRFTYESPLRTIVTYGGAEIRDQMRELSNGCDILVATPGRLVDLVQRGAVSLRNVSFLVLDEADRMLDMGFEPQVRQIVSSFDMPSTEDGRQTSMFSATFPKEIQRLAQDFLGDYLFVTVGRVGSTTTTIEQRLVWIEPERKLDELVQQLKKVPGLTLVFVSMKKDCDRIEHQLNSSGIRAVSIHGDRVQREREYSLEMFMSGKARVLVATDVAARGLDINDVSHVINFDVPSEIDTYVHRIGRTGRAGNKGIATTFFNEQDAKIAPLLLDTLEEAGQTIPSWLRSVAEQVKEGAMRSRGERGGRRGGGGDRFGAKDVRDIGSKPSSTSTPSTTAPPATSGGGGSRGGRGLRRGGAGGANHSNGAKTVTDSW